MKTMHDSPFGLRFKTAAMLLAALVVFSAPESAVAAGRGAPPLPAAAHRALFEAWQKMEAGDPAAAATVLENFRAGRPGWQKREDRDPQGYFHPRVDFHLANCYLALGRPREAAGLYEHTLSREPDFTPAWQNLARACWEDRRFSRAAEAFRRGYATAAEPRPELLHYAARALQADDRPAEALAVLQPLLADPGREAPVAWRELQAHLLLTLERPREALAPMRILTESTTGDRQRRWREVLVGHYLRLEMQSEAGNLLQRLTRLEPEHPGWWREWARLQLARGRHLDSLAALMIVDCLETLSTGETRLAGDLSLNAEVPALAQRYYRRALREEQDGSLYRRLVQSYLRLHRPRKALETVRRALDRHPDVELRLLEGEILFELRNYAGAREALSALVEAEPENGRGWLLLGYAACNLSDWPGARTALARAAAFSAQQAAARRLIEELDRTEME